jgi:hypothetical protein
MSVGTLLALLIAENKRRKRKEEKKRRKEKKKRKERKNSTRSLLVAMVEVPKVGAQDAGTADLFTKRCRWIRMYVDKKTICRPYSMSACMRVFVLLPTEESRSLTIGLAAWRGRLLPS